ncbi:MAG: MarR family transcriptional regulator, partial [Nannocystaceae bacterium]|nr:MarR family transcriptional regulator [Nannocystaceae bacterium]
IPSSADEVAEVLAGDCLAVRVRLLNRAITAIYDDALRPLGLTAGQLNVLVMIKRNGPVSPTEIAERLHMEKSTVSRNVARMRDNGWLTTAESVPGQRQELTLSRKGSALLVRSYSAWHKAQADAGIALGRGGAESILRTANSVWGEP